MQTQNLAEHRAISAFINNNNAGDVRTSALTREHFTELGNLWHWLVNHTNTTHRVPDLDMVVNEYPNFRHYETDDIGYWESSIISKFKMRSMTKLLIDASDNLGEVNPDDMVDEIANSLEKIKTVTTSVDGISATEDWEEALRHAERCRAQYESGELSGVTLGLPSLNHATNGLQPGWLAIIASRLGGYKTAMACHVAEKARQKGKRVAFVSLEMPWSEIQLRIHSLAAQSLYGQAINTHHVNGGTIDIQEYAKFLRRYADEGSNGGEILLFDSTHRLDTPGAIERMINIKEPDLVIVDYIGLLSRSQEWQSIAETTTNLQRAAKRTMTPILALAQVNRGTDEDFDSQRIAGSDQIGRDADLIIAMSRHNEAPEVRRVRIIKNRGNHATTDFLCKMDLSTGTICEIDEEIANQLEDERAARINGYAK